MPSAAHAALGKGAFAECLDLGTRQSVALPSATWLALGKVFFRRVLLDIVHSAKPSALGIRRVSGSGGTKFTLLEIMPSVKRPRYIQAAEMLVYTTIKKTIFKAG